MTDLERSFITSLAGIARQAERLSSRLSSASRPGHCDYINKADAALCADSIARDAREALSVLDTHGWTINGIDGEWQEAA
jgi:hypothetical protein